MLVEHLRDDVGLICKDPVEQQTVHGLQHRSEAARACLGARERLREGDGEDIDGEHEQDERGEDSAQRHGDAFDQDHQLRHVLQEPGQAGSSREAEEPHEPEHRAVCHAGRRLVLAIHEHEHGVRHPSPPDHHGHQDRVEDKPKVVHGVALATEGLEADQDLKGEERAKDVFDGLELQRGPWEDRLLVEVRVDGYPERVEDDDAEREVLERATPGQGLRKPSLVVEQLHVVLLLDNRLLHLFLHSFGVREHVPPPYLRDGGPH
mmetsp:Transcript_98491/g.274021  ORF Transcript_98491/g.274021 Transcript_98491/m.274021 type:complete len:263 (+) Transcript_98491:708-1496(+)